MIIIKLIMEKSHEKISDQFQNTDKDKYFLSRMISW